MLKARISHPLRITQSNKLQKKTVFWTPLKNNLLQWKQQDTPTEGWLGISQTPPLPTELNSHPQIGMLQQAAGTTMFPWLGGGANNKNFRTMETMCPLEMVSDINLRTEWLGNFGVLIPAESV
jgi:hypothetical protein